MCTYAGMKRWSFRDCPSYSALSPGSRGCKGAWAGEDPSKRQEKTIFQSKGISLRHWEVTRGGDWQRQCVDPVLRAHCCVGSTARPTAVSHQGDVCPGSPPDRYHPVPWGHFWGITVITGFGLPGLATWPLSPRPTPRDSAFGGWGLLGLPPGKTHREQDIACQLPEASWTRSPCPTALL